MVYQAYAGVSVGALVASLLAQFPTGKEAEAYEELENIFSPIEDRNVFRRWWPFGKLHGLWKPSLLNSKPLQKLVRKRLDPTKLATSGKLLRVGAVSLDSGRYELFDQDFYAAVDAVLASASYPAFLTPVLIPGMGLYTDGGVREVTPIKALIDLGCTDIDVVMCQPNNAPFKFPRSPSAIDVALRALDLMSDQTTWDDVKKANLYNRLIEAGLEGTKRKVNLTIAHPDKVLNEDPLHFDPAEARELQEKGYAAAQKAFPAS